MNADAAWVLTPERRPNGLAAQARYIGPDYTGLTPRRAAKAMFLTARWGSTPPASAPA